MPSGMALAILIATFPIRGMRRKPRLKSTDASVTDTPEVAMYGMPLTFVVTLILQPNIATQILEVDTTAESGNTASIEAVESALIVATADIWSQIHSRKVRVLNANGARLLALDIVYLFCKGTESRIDRCNGTTNYASSEVLRLKLSDLCSKSGDFTVLARRLESVDLVIKSEGVPVHSVSQGVGLLARCKLVCCRLRIDCVTGTRDVALECVGLLTDSESVLAATRSQLASKGGVPALDSIDYLLTGKTDL